LPRALECTWNLAYGYDYDDDDVVVVDDDDDDDDDDDNNNNNNEVIIIRKNLEAVPGKHSIDSLQRTATLGTSHTIRKVLQCEAWILSGGDHCWFKRITRKNRPVTRDIIIITITIIIIITIIIVIQWLRTVNRPVRGKNLKEEAKMKLII